MKTIAVYSVPPITREDPDYLGTRQSVSKPVRNETSMSRRLTMMYQLSERASIEIVRRDARNISEEYSSINIAKVMTEQRFHTQRPPSRLVTSSRYSLLT